MKKSPASQSDGIIGLVREAIDGLGDLVGQHLHLARLELISDLRAVGRRTRRSAVFGALAVIGYTLGLAGLAVFLGGQQPIGTWMLAFGGGHLIVAGLGFLIGRSGNADKRLMNTNLEQVGESIATLQRAITSGGSEPTALPATAALPPAALPSNGRPVSAGGGAGR